MFFHRFACIALCCTLFSGSFICFAPAEVVQAFRQPSDEDLQWLLGDVTAPIPNTASPSAIVQAGHVSEKSGTLAPSGGPCRPVKMLRPSKFPNPPIPPAPQVGQNKINGGLEAGEDGVVSITSVVMESSLPVMQMSGDRLPPPSEVPKEQGTSIIVPMEEPAIERLPKPVENLFTPDVPPCSDVIPHSGTCKLTGCGSADTDDYTCLCITCVTCGDTHKKFHKDKKSDYCRCGISDGEEGACQPEGACGEIYKKYETVDRGPLPDMIGGSAWLTGYHVEFSGSTPTTTFVSTFTLPTMLLTRPNAAEHFNADTQNRIWADYRHWNNVVSIDRAAINRLTDETYRSLESRGGEQFSFGAEKLLMNNTSVECRVPIIYQFGSNQADDIITSAELGNVSVFMKQVMKRGARWTFSGGVGTTLPTAESWQPFANVRLKNNAYYLVSFLGAQWHPNRSTFGHFVVQADVPIEKNELVLDGNSPLKVAGQQMIRTGIQLGRWIYRTDQGKRPCRFGAVAEINYAVVTEGSARQGLPFGTQTNGTYPDGTYPDGSYEVSVSAFNARKSTLTAAVGMPMVFGKLTCSNSLILPISGSHRPFSVGYNFSLARQF